MYKACIFTEEWKRKRVAELYGRWRRWKADLGPKKLVPDMVTAHSDYRKMAEFGWTAVNFILGQLSMGDIDYYIFPMLSAITGARPVCVGHRNDLKAMAEDWIRWEKERKARESFLRR